jgi:hypothetical protein
MGRIKLYEEFLNENNPVDDSFQKKLQKKYNKEDTGFIIAWGGLLYLSYHNMKTSGKTQSDSQIKDAMIELSNAEDGSSEYEDLQDWLVDGGYEDGIPLWNKKALEQYFINISKKTPAPIDFQVYRTSPSSSGEQPGFNSYTTQPGTYHFSSGNTKTISYMIPKGTPVIFASNIADKNEIIWNPTSNDLKQYKTI